MAFEVSQTRYEGVILINPTTGQPYTSANADKHTTVTTYKVKTNFSAASVGQTITCTQVIDISTDPPTTLSALWRNQSTSSDLGAAPLAEYLTLMGATALTDAELRATPIDVNVVSPGTATSGNQIQEIGYLDSINDKIGRFSDYMPMDIDSSTEFTTYILKQSSTTLDWLVVRLLETPTAMSIRYATILNNPAVTISQAWTNRSTLTFGVVSAI